MALNGNSVTLKLSLVIAILTLILSSTIFGINQIRAKADREEVLRIEERCNQKVRDVQEELRDRIKELSAKQDKTNDLIMQLIQDGKGVKQ